MAGRNTNEVRLGAPQQVGGYGRYAPMGTPRPKDAATPLDAAYIDFGYISEDGVEVITDSGSDKIKDWDQETVAIIQKSNECSVKFTLLQISPQTARLMFGANNVETTGTGDAEMVTAIHYTGKLLKSSQFAFLMEDTNGPMILDVADGTVTGFKGFKFKKTEVIAFEVELELRKDKLSRFFSLWTSNTPGNTTNPIDATGGTPGGTVGIDTGV